MAPGSRDAQESGRRVLTWRINYLLLQNKLSPTCPLETVGTYYPAGPMGQKPGPDVDGAAASQGVRVGGPFPAAVPGPGPLLAAGCGQGSSLGAEQDGSHLVMGETSSLPRPPIGGTSACQLRSRSEGFTRARMPGAGHGVPHKGPG